MPKSYIESLIIKTFPEDPYTALAIAKAESNLVSYASNWGDSHKTCKGSFGIFQVGCLHESDYTKLYDVEYNIIRARQIYDQAGSWEPWGAYTSGAYLAKM